MLDPDGYELFLFKLGVHLFFKLGVVKYRGDRYVYGDHDMIEIKQSGQLVEINLYNPLEHGGEEEGQGFVGITAVDTLYIMPGQNCSDELKIIHDHIRQVNEFHIIYHSKSIGSAKAHPPS